MGVVLDHLLLVPEARVQERREDRAIAQERRSGIARSDNEVLLSEHRDSLAERTAARTSAAALRQQKNLDQVALAALSDLNQSPPQPEAPEVSDDFLNRFERLAGDASSEEMQALFARILAGEIRRPGTFSLQALHTFAMIDGRTAPMIERVAGWAIDGVWIPSGGPLGRGPTVLLLGELEGLGLIHTGLAMRILDVWREKPRTLLRVGGRVIHMRPTIVVSSPAASFPTAGVTEVGRQVFSVLSPTISDDDFMMIKEALTERGHLEILEPE